MNGKPELLYTDDETALNTQAIQDYLKEQGIAHHRTRGHPNFSERAIRTYYLQLRQRGKNKQLSGSKCACRASFFENKERIRTSEVRAK